MKADLAGQQPEALGRVQLVTSAWLSSVVLVPQRIGRVSPSRVMRLAWSVPSSCRAAR